MKGYKWPTMRQRASGISFVSWKPTPDVTSPYEQPGLDKKKSCASVDFGAMYYLVRTQDVR